MGVLDMACSYANLGWTQQDINKFGNYLTTPLSADPKVGSFIPKELWKKIMDDGKFADKMFKLDLKAVVSDYANGPGSSGRGGRR